MRPASDTARRGVSPFLGGADDESEADRGDQHKEVRHLAAPMRRSWKLHLLGVVISGKARCCTGNSRMIAITATPPVAARLICRKIWYNMVMTSLVLLMKIRFGGRQIITFGENAGLQ